MRLGFIAIKDDARCPVVAAPETNGQNGVRGMRCQKRTVLPTTRPFSPHFRMRPPSFGSEVLPTRKIFHMDSFATKRLLQLVRLVGGPAKPAKRLGQKKRPQFRKTIKWKSYKRI